MQLQIDGIKHSLRSLLGDVEVDESRLSEKAFPRPISNPTKAVRKNAGFFVDGNSLSLYFREGAGRYVVLRIRRPNGEFTTREKNLFRPFSKIMVPLLTDSDHGFGRSVEGVLSFHSLEHLVVAASMRGGAAKLNSIALPILVLSLVDWLSRTRYEGQPATSGFVFVKKIAQFLASPSVDHFELEAFPQPVPLTLEHFSAPASYRYVDGRNAFYLVGRDTCVHGIARVKAPQAFGTVDRAGYAHIAPLLAHPFVPWVAYVGLSDDANVVLSNQTAFRFVRSHWRYFEIRRLLSVLAGTGLPALLAGTLADVILAMSDHRTGTLILIPDSSERLPEVAGGIDTSEISAQLRKAIAGKSIADLVGQGRAMGVLGSDGLTTLRSDGVIVGTGEIIRLTGSAGSVAGGGRTQAAVAASGFGTCIKVSEDGPITVWRNGGQVLRVDR